MPDEDWEDIADDMAYRIRFVGYMAANMIGSNSRNRENSGVNSAENGYSEDNTSGTKSENSSNGGENMVDLGRADADLRNEFDQLEEAIEQNDYEEALEYIGQLGQDLGVYEDALDVVEQDYDDLREATYARLNELTDRVQEVRETWEQDQEQYQEVVDGLEALDEKAASIEISDEHELNRQRDDEFINRYLDDSE